MRLIRLIGRIGLIGLICLIGLSGCKNWRTITVEKPVYVHDTTHTIKEVHDSTFIDRWHTIYQKGDTIFVTDEVTKIVTKIVKDTAYKIVEKPVTITKTETIEVKKTLSWWQKTQIYGFWAFIAVISILLVYKYRKYIYNPK